jgi:4-amino-4-deoxy-L-arabinose transferase-like glycosyltransferase
VNLRHDMKHDPQVMQDNMRPSKTAAAFVAVVGLFLLVFGFTMFSSFGTMLRLFLHLSPDGSFVPQTLLVLKSSFLSFGLVGVCLLLFLLLWGNVLKGAFLELENLPEARFLLLFLGLGLVLRLLWILLVPTQLYADWKWYDDAAYHLSQVWRYEENGVPTAYWPIGYPLFLAVIYWIFGHSYLAVHLISVLLSLCICILTYQIAKRLIGPAAARLSLVILVFFPGQIFFTNVLSSEILFTTLLLAMILILLKTREQSSIFGPLIVGLLLGLLIMVRAVALVLPLLIVLFYLKWGRRSLVGLRNTILSLIVVCLVLLPWLMRNKRVLDTFSIATSGGIDLYIGNSPISSGNWVWTKQNPFADLSAPNEVENNKLGYQLAAKFIMGDPVGFVIRGIKKEVYMFATDFGPIAKELDLAAQAHRVDGFVIVNVVGQSYYLVVLILSAAGLFLLLKDKERRKPGFYLLVGTVAYWLAIHFVFFGIDRFHFPLVPILAIWASFFAVSQIEPSGERYNSDASM